MNELRIINNIINDKIKVYIDNELVENNIAYVNDTFKIRIEIANLLDDDAEFKKVIKDNVKKIILNNNAEINEHITPVSGHLEADVIINKDSELVISAVKDVTTIALDINIEDAIILNKKVMSYTKNSKRYILLTGLFYIAFLLISCLSLIVFIKAFINCKDLYEKIILTIFSTMFLIGISLASYFYIRSLLSKKREIDKNIKNNLEKKNKKLRNLVISLHIIHIAISAISIILIFMGFGFAFILSAIVFIVKSWVTSNLKDYNNIESKKLSIISIIMLGVCLLSLFISIGLYSV